MKWLAVCRIKWLSTSPRSHPRRAQPITMQIRAGCSLGGLLRCNHISWPERKRLSDLNHWRLKKRRGEELGGWRSVRAILFSLPWTTFLSSWPCTWLTNQTIQPSLYANSQQWRGVYTGTDLAYRFFFLWQSRKDSMQKKETE